MKKNEIELQDNANKLKREYYKKWRANNKDRIKDYNSKYWKKKAQCLKNNSSKTK